MSRFEVRPFSPDSIPAAARLLAERHRHHRVEWPALDPAYEDPRSLEPLIADLLGRQGASGAIAFAGADPAAYVLGAPKAASWGPNVWVDDAGSAGDDPEAIRTAYAHAAADWVAAGRTSHYVVVPASDEATVSAWFSLSFGRQHVHALQPAPGPDFQPRLPPGLSIREAQEPDIPALVALDRVLPTHQANSPVFAPSPVPTETESIANIAEELGDTRFTTLVALHDGRVIGTATACPIELSHANTPLMQPPRCGFLGFAAVAPDARGLGAGRALGEAVLAWSRDQGYDWVAADWRSTNLEADRTWRAAGFRPTFYRLYRAID